MILYFKIMNFKSILDLTLSTKFDEGKAPNRYKDSEYIIFIEDNNIRAYPILSIYGANASGKSNIIEAIETFQKIIIDGIDEIEYKPNKLNSIYSNTTFEIGFIINNKSYSYRIAYNATSIIEECLLQDDKILISSKNNNLEKVFQNSTLYNTKKLTEIYNVECKNSLQLQITSFLMKLAKNYANLNVELASVYDYLSNNLIVSRSNKVCSHYDAVQRLTKEVGDEKTALERITNLIRKFDIDIEDILLELKNASFKEFNGSFWTDIIAINKQKEEVEYSQFFSTHKDIKNNIIKFMIQEESSGTQSLISIIGVILTVLEKGGVLIIDELDRSIHPLLLIQLYRLFKDKRYNRNKAQMIFTLHCTDLLEDELLRKSEVGIVTKTKKQGSLLTRLSEYDNLRNILDFRKRYLDGEFSGIPYAYI